MQSFPSHHLLFQQSWEDAVAVLSELSDNLQKINMVKSVAGLFAKLRKVVSTTLMRSFSLRVRTGRTITGTGCYITELVCIVSEP